MDLKTVLALAQNLLPPDLWNKAVLAAGYFTLIGQIVPWILSRGIPAATRVADWLARVSLASPLRPLILWQAPAIIRFLDNFTAALEKVADTFKGRLESDIEAAAAPVAPVMPAKQG